MTRVLAICILLNGCAALDAARYYQACGMEWYKCK